MKDWLELQRRIYTKVQREVNTRLGKRSLSLVRYEREFDADQRKLQPSKEKRFYSQMAKTDVLFVGDFHALKQSQKFFLRLLRDPRLRKPKTIALEAVSPAHESLLERWMKKPRASLERQLRESLNLEERFGSHFEIYRDLFQTARAMGISIRGLGSKSSQLQIRDREAAQRLAKLEHPIWVLFGAFHCARKHLPGILHELNPSLKLTVVQQDDDRLSKLQMSGQFLKQNLFEAAPLHGISLFCFQHSPCWVKWQSLLHHLEQEDLEMDHQEQVAWFLKTLSGFLEDPRYLPSIREASLHDFNVVGPDEEAFEKSLKKLSSKDLRQALAQLELSRVAVNTTSKQILLLESTINSCAHAAASYLIAQSWKRIPHVEDFHSWALYDCLCFFLSKILNHSRRTRHWIDFKDTPSQSTFTKKLLKSKDFYKKFADPSWTQSLKPYRAEISTQLARIIADNMFESFLAGEFTKERVNRILRSPPKSEEEAFLMLTELYSAGLPFERHKALLY